jgi:DHA1 family tetracycline resistance protein-like MFS transporter
LLVCDNFNLDPRSPKDADTVTYLFSFSGVLGALVQGGGIGKLVKKLGEPKLISLSLVLVAVAMIPMPFLKTWPLFLVALGLLSIGTSLTRPPVFGMISNLTPATEQGVTIGVAQSAGSLSRIVGPIFAGTLYTHHPAIPYLACGILSLITGILAWQFLQRPSPVPTSAPTAAVVR